MWVWNFTASAPASAIASTKAWASPRLPSCACATSPMTTGRRDQSSAVIAMRGRLVGTGQQAAHAGPDRARHGAREGAGRDRAEERRVELRSQPGGELARADARVAL